MQSQINTRSKTSSIADYLDKSDTHSYGVDNYNAIMDYLGSLNTQVQPSAFEGISHSIYDLAEAFKGQATMYNKLITGFIFWKNDFMTAKILPWSKIKGLDVKWQHWHFDNPFFGKTPNRSISHLLSSKKAEHGDTVIRRGLAFHMESDYLETDDGKLHLLLSIKGLAQSVQETQNFECMRALQTCKTYGQLWQQIFGKTNYTIQEILAYEADNFLALNHDTYAMANMVENYRRVFNARGIDPDTLILPSGMTQYLAMHDHTSDYVRYDVSGGKGLSDHEAGEKAFNNKFRNLDVFETREYTGYVDQEPTQMQYADYVFGERYEMILKNCEKIKKYKTCARDIYISDFSKNEFVKVKFEQAFLKTHIFDDNGNFTSYVKKLIDNYNRNTNGRVYSDEDPSEVNWNDPTKRTHETAFAFACKNSSGSWTTPTHFGKFGYHALGLDDLTMMSETLLNKLDKCDPDCSNVGIYNQMLGLVKKIEKEPYNEPYFDDIYVENMMDPGNNTWGVMTPRIGEETSPQLSNLRIKEAPRNKFGSFNLRLNNRPHRMYPAGYANGPGFQYLASLKDENTEWNDVAAVAHKSVVLIENMVNLLNSTFPSSEMINPENRDPWFHSPDPIATFFSLVVSTRRDPIFMPRLQVDRIGHTIQGREVLEKLDHNASIALLVQVKDVFTGTNPPVALENWIDGLRRKCKITNPIFVLLQHMGIQSGITLIDLALTDSNVATSPGWVYINKFAEFILESGEKIPETIRPELWIKIRQLLLSIQAMAPDLPRGGKDYRTIVPLFNIFANATENKKELNNFIHERISQSIQADAHLPDLIRRALHHAFDEASGIQGGLAANQAICWYRTPLTMSLALLKSLTDVATPYCQPGDYTTGNIYPFAVNAANPNIAEHYINRAAYRDLEKPTMFKELRHYQLAKRFAYVATKPFSRKRKESSGGSQYSKTKKKKQSLYFFNEDSEEDEEFEDPQYYSYNRRVEEIDQELAERQPLSAALNYPLLLQNPNAPFQDAATDVLDFNTDTLSRRWLDGFTIQDPLVRAIYFSILFSQCDKREHWLALLTNDVHFPLNILLFRLNITVQAANGIMCQRGYQLGISAYNYPDFQFSRATATKELLGHYTIWTKAIIFDPDKIMHLRALRAVRYGGGYNTAFIESKDDFLSRNIDRPSLIACLTSAREKEYPRFISFTGSFPPQSNSSGQNDRTQWSSAGFYSIVYGVNPNYFLNKINKTLADSETSPNHIAAQGLQFNWNFKDKLYNIKVDSQSHLRDKGSAPGAIRVLNGIEKMFSDYDFNSKKLV